ncbi:MAG TPA: NnrS family protein, partial [Burkholderiales bacterium]|nr:NnrS family protein [Burkholderiales bacterium]
YMHGFAPAAMPAMIWHAHEMIYGYAVAALAGFLLTAIPNWTGRLPLSGAPLAALAALWLAGRVALLVSARIGAAAAMLVDLAFIAVLAALIARELIAGRNFRNLPMVAALAVLFAGNLLVHLQGLDIAYTAALGNRLGIATLCALIALVGGRIVPSFTRNWLVRARPRHATPASPSRLDLACLLTAVAALAAWAAFPDSRQAWALEIVGGGALALRLARWRGLATLREPLLAILHLGYAWLAFGLAFLGLNGFFAWLPPSAGVHALTVGAVGTMTLAVMTRASLGHTGRPLHAGPGTTAIYGFVTLAALLRVAAPLGGARFALLTSLAGLAWSAAFGLFVLVYGPLLARARTT